MKDGATGKILTNRQWATYHQREIIEVHRRAGRNVFHKMMNRRRVILNIFCTFVGRDGWSNRQNSYQQAVGNLSPEREQRGNSPGIILVPIFLHTILLKMIRNSLTKSIEIKPVMIFFLHQVGATGKTRTSKRWATCPPTTLAIKSIREMRRCPT